MSDLISRSEAKKLGATCLAKRNENGQLEAIISLDNAPTVEAYPFDNITDEQISDAFQIAIANYWEEMSKHLTPPPTSAQCFGRIMNNDLISREALKKSIKSYADDQYAENEYLGEYAIMDIIDNTPTVPLPDFKEGYKQAIIDGKTNFSRPQGEWIFDGVCFTTTQYKCNKCKCPTLEKTNFCPNCGADMRKGEEE